jgi:YegS/Rv2252/BmrU family lipid kinase
MQDVLIFANPIAGRGRGGAIAQAIAQRLAQQQYGVRTFVQSADCVDLGQYCATGRVRAVVVIGGDGTLRTAAQSLLDACGAAAPPLLLVPMGTANLMGKHLGIEWEQSNLADQVAAAITHRHVVYLDAARANGRLFLLMAGIGIDAGIVHELQRMRRGPINLLSYALPALKVATQYNYPPLTVSVNGRPIFGPQPAIAFVGNIPEYGTGFAVLPYARSDDRVLDVCVLPCRSRSELVNLLLHAAAGEHVAMEGVIYVKATDVALDSPQRVPVQVDGDAAGFTPLQIQLSDHRVGYIVPVR